MTINGSSAYPVDRDKINKEYTGLTKREYFAAMAWQAMMTNPALLEVVTPASIMDGTAADMCANKAIEWTDSFIKSLNKYNQWKY